jgi:hypothetical protein
MIDTASVAIRIVVVDIFDIPTIIGPEQTVRIYIDRFPLESLLLPVESSQTTVPRVSILLLEFRF